MLKKIDKGGGGLLHIPLGPTVLVLLMLQICWYHPSVGRIPPQRSDMTVSAEKIVIMCYEGVGAGKKMEPRIHMTVSFFSVPSICQNFHHGLCPTWWPGPRDSSSMQRSLVYKLGFVNSEHLGSPRTKSEGKWTKGSTKGKIYQISNCTKNASDKSEKNPSQN